jgi:hypothetical protein
MCLNLCKPGHSREVMNVITVLVLIILWKFVSLIGRAFAFVCILVTQLHYDEVQFV